MVGWEWGVRRQKNSNMLLPLVLNSGYPLDSAVERIKKEKKNQSNPCRELEKPNQVSLFLWDIQGNGIKRG